LFNDTVLIAQVIGLYLSLDVSTNQYCYVTDNYADLMETDFWNNPEEDGIACAGRHEEERRDWTRPYDRPV
jgi:hypothetical protein